MALAGLFGNFKTAPESVDIDYGGETHALNSFHYRGNSRVREESDPPSGYSRRRLHAVNLT